MTWVRGIGVIFHKTHTGMPLLELIKHLEKKPPTRVPNTAIFLSSDADIVPTALLHNLKHNMVLHEHNVVMNVRTAQIPRVDDADRVRIERLSADFSRVILTFGYMEKPNIPWALLLARRQGLKFDIMKTSFFVGRRTISPPPNRPCRSGRTICSWVSPAMPPMPATSSTSRPAGRRARHAGDHLTAMKR